MKSSIRRLAFVALAVAMSLVPTPSHAELIDNGNGLIYDTVLDITWAQVDPSPQMSWDEANTWAAGLMLGGVSGWRLPYISVAAGAGPFSGTPVDCELATEPECRDNELGYMFYWNFGSDFGQPVPPNGDPAVLALFPGLYTFTIFWTGTEYDQFEAWNFSFANGYQGTDGVEQYGVWAVHDGNVGGGGSPPSDLYADFTFSPTVISENQVVEFSDRSQGDVVAWLWTFDPAPPEGGTDTNQNTTRYWSRHGTLHVSLEVWDASGTSDIMHKTTYIQPVLEPDASFDWYPAAPVVGEEVQFTDTSAFNPTSWLWVFGTTGTSTEQHPVHTFDQAGVYSVQLEVSNQGGTNDEIIPVEVFAETQPPEANFFYRPTILTVNEVIQFFSASRGGPADTWAWDFGDGGFSDAEFTQHTFTEEGTYDVTLTVTNSAGQDSHVIPLTFAAEVPPIDPDLDQLYFVASAARTGGVGDSFFVTDVDVNNAGGGMATYKVAWLPRDTDNSDPTVSDALTIEAGQTVRWSDVLGTVFGVPDGTDAAGAVAFVSDSQDLKIFSRTYNSSDAGTFGQAIPGMAAADLIPTGTTKRILFFTENGPYRSNMGFLNGTGTAMTINWRRYTADGTMVEDGSSELPAWGNTQLNKVFRGEAPAEGAYVDVWTETSGAAFTAYGSVLDNATSDPTTVLPD